MLVRAEIRKIVMTPSGCAVFLGTPRKTFVLYVGAGVGVALSMAVEGVRKPRPLTHDLISSILRGLGVSIERAVINAIRGDTFYARLFLREEGEQGTRIVEVDARPSDCLVLAAQNKIPVFVDSGVLKGLEDVGHMLREGEEADDA